MIEQLAEMMNLMSNGEIGEIMTRVEIASYPKKLPRIKISGSLNTNDFFRLKSSEERTSDSAVGSFSSSD